MAQPLLNNLRKHQASAPDEASSLSLATLADLVGADQPLTEADLHGIQELTALHLKSQETAIINDGCGEQQHDGDPGPAFPSLAPPPATTKSAPVSARLQELFPWVPSGQLQVK